MVIGSFLFNIQALIPSSIQVDALKTFEVLKTSKV